MKPRYLIIVAAILVVVGAVLLIRKEPEIPPAPKAPATTGPTVSDDGMELTTATNPTLVFQKAFWRHPADDDKILHAERREWSSEEGVQKWQWFIAVQPGPELLRWLETNPFSLATKKSGGAIENRPAWFPNSFRDFQIQQNAEGRFTLMLSADRKRLYATDSGLGFTPPGIAP